MERSDSQSEAGSALLTALFASLVLGALVVIFVGNAVSQTRASFASQGFEQTLHVAEAATDVALSRLAENRSYFTTTAGVSGNERTWAINQADLAVGASCQNAVRVGQGQAIPVVARRSTWMDATTVYGVGYLPDCLTRTTVRVVKMELVAQPVENYAPGKAIVSGGNVDLTGNVTVVGGVHANGTLKYGGSSGAVDQASAGTCGAGSTGISCTQTPPVGVPAWRARDYWELRTNPSLDLSVPWYDMCVDGKVYIPRPEPAPVGPTDPCEGVALSAGNRPVGWTFDPLTRIWRHSGNTMSNGVYYAVDSNIVIEDSPSSARATLIAQGKTSELVTDVGSKSGSITIEFNPKFTPVWPGVGLVADVDINILKNGAFDGTQAMMYAREQIRWSQNHKTSGVFFVACDESLGSSWSQANPKASTCPAPAAVGSRDSTIGSPVHYVPSQSISLQNMNLSFDGKGITLVPGSDKLSIARWQELR